MVKVTWMDAPLSDLIEKLDTVLTSDIVEDVWAFLTADLATYGFDRLFYGYTQFRTSHNLGHRDDLIVFSNHSDEYLEVFLGKEMYMSAPMTQWAIENNGSKSWSWLSDLRETLTEDQVEVLNFNLAHDVVAGYTVSFPESSPRHRAAIALTAKAGMTQAEVDEVWSQHGKEIEVLVNVAHLKLKNLPYPIDKKRLSARQVEVLEWVGDGKTAQDIATIMGLTAATVEKHLKNARESLAVDTTAQAVLKASLQKQIFVLDPLSANSRD